MLNENLLYLKNIDKNFHLLYVEDNIKVQNETVKMLENFIPNIKVAQNGIEGLELYEKHFNSENLNKFDLVITDINMPQKDGLNMIKTIKEINHDIFILIFSAYNYTNYFQEAIKIGIDGYILKPYTLEEISETISNVLKKREKRNIVKLISNYTWSNTNKILIKNSNIIKLSKNEIKLISFLLSSEKSIKASDDIENLIFDDFLSDNKRVRSLIYRLNNKLDTNIIESVYSLGYRIKTI